ncbi:MAG TPA: hypothetical protein HPP81_01355 [Deltaproteobacteria bacterium]|jgi:hypothetical protein|nr:hypothetical protein [Deltaproteobacteria bacterium]
MTVTNENFKQNPISDAIRRTLTFYHPDGTTFELCGIGTDRYPKAVDGGFFDDHEKAIETACKLTMDHHAVYLTINPADPALLSRANNRIKPGLARTQDREVLKLQRLFIDADPVRPAGTNSTDSEHDTALDLSAQIKADQGALGWPEPLVGDSGNGGHLIYRLPDLPNTTENIELLKACLQALAQRYNTDTHHIDETTFNPSRLSKLYGTWARKGDSTPDRPQRLARIISVPDHPEPVPLERLNALAKSATFGRAADPQPKSAPGTGSGKFDLPAYLERYSVHVKQVKPHGDSTLHVLECCLFDETHTGGEAAVGQKADGPLFYFCYHNSCKGRTWADARQKISGDAKLAKPGESGKETKETQAQWLIQLAADAELFHSPESGHYAIVLQNGHREVWSIRTKGFKNWLDHRFYRDQGKPPGTQGLQDAIRLLEAKAVFDGEEHRVFVRVGGHGGNVYLDLCNSSWEVVEITPSGWRVLSDPPVRFRRAKGMLALPNPVPGGSLNQLRPFLNLPDDDAFCLDCGFLVQALNPSGPYPILTLEGEQGAAKSSKARTLRSLVDPSTAMLRTAPRDDRDLMIAATNSWLLAFDNLSGVENWLSDALCRISTGGGLSTRELYSDSEEIIFEAMRPQILNGIDRIASRHDLLDRSICITLPVIPDDKRKEEKEFWRDFEAARPFILGALCDAVSCALRNISTTKLDRLPRMADFAKWVTAAEPALPWKPGEFMKAYTGNRANAVKLALDVDIVACWIRQFMGDKSQWEGTATDLLSALGDLVPDDTRKLREWPKAPNSLGHRLRRAATFLRAESIEITLPSSESWRRYITIRKSLQKIVDTVETVETGNGGGSTINDTINDIVDAEKTVGIPLMDKPAPDKAFHDVNDFNDKKHTFSKEVIEL